MELYNNAFISSKKKTTAITELKCIHTIFCVFMFNALIHNWWLKQIQIGICKTVKTQTVLLHSAQTI